MNLGTRIGLAMTGLVGVTALGCAGAAVGVTTQRLDAEIRRSIDLVAGPVRRSVKEARFTCGLDNFERETSDDVRPTVGSKRGRGPIGDNDDGIPRRTVPRELVVQCIDTKGKVLPTSPSNIIPIRASDIDVAAGRRREQTSRTTINDEDHLVDTIPVAGLGAVQIARRVDERDRVIANLVSRNALIAAIATLLSVAAGWWVSRRIARPLQLLTASTEQIRITRDLDAVDFEPLKTNDEVGRLSVSFVSMLESLRQSKEAQARLVQDAGHELRTPLTSVRMNVAMLSRENLTPQKRAEVKADVEAELHELTMVTNELIAIAADNARTEPPVPVDVVALVRSACPRWERRSQRAVRLSLPSVLPTDGLFVLIAPTALQRIVDNLISNAIKFTAGDTAIVVSVDSVTSAVGSSVRLSVRDHGPGIPTPDLPHVFDRFYRSDQARSVTGSGLGLAIVKELATRAHGTVEASNADGGGALFVVRFPALSAT